MIFAFGEFELDLAVAELRRAGTRIPVEPQVFEVMAHLVAHRDRVVPKEELLDTVWGSRFVTEAALTSRIKQARQALGDDGRTQRLIRTVHGKGYRFVSTVVQEAAPAPVAPRREPVRYAVSDDLNIAYQVTGQGERDLVLIAGFVSHLDLDWAEPRHAGFLDRLGTFGRLIRFDKRGTGMSDRPQGLPDLETRMRDVLVVMDAVGSRRAVLFGYSEGAPMACLFAAVHPERVEALVLYGAYAKRLRAPDYPWAPTEEEREKYGERLAVDWSWDADMRVMCPSADDEMAQWWGQRARAAATPSTVRALIGMNSLVDVRAALGSIAVPTLVLHRRGDRDSQVEEGRYLADQISGARFVELPGVDHFVAINPDQILDPVEQFLAEIGPAPAPPRALAAVLAVAGDADVARSLTASRSIRVSGEHRIAVYDGPATAIRDVLSVLSGQAPAAFGLNIAEIPRIGTVVDGPGVDHAVALARRASPGQLLVSRAVRDLVASSGFVLTDAGHGAYEPRAASPAKASRT